MKKKDIFIYTKENFKGATNNSETMETILPVYWPKVPFLDDGTFDDKDVAQKVVNRRIGKKQLMSAYEQANKDTSIFGHTDLVEIQPVFITKRSRKYDGVYYAHEYNEFLDGYVQRLEYSNGYYEYIITCTTKGKYVADGVWDKDLVFGNKYENGSGDWFETNVTPPWERKKRG